MSWPSFFIPLQGAFFFKGATELPPESRDKLKQALKLLEDFLGDKKYFAGDHPTIADISILSNVIQAKNAFDALGSLPKLDAWFERCKELPGFEENMQGGVPVREFFKAKGIVVSLIDWAERLDISKRFSW